MKFVCIKIIWFQQTEQYFIHYHLSWFCRPTLSCVWVDWLLYSYFLSHSDIAISLYPILYRQVIFKNGVHFPIEQAIFAPTTVLVQRVFVVLEMTSSPVTGGFQAIDWIWGCILVWWLCAMLLLLQDMIEEEQICLINALPMLPNMNKIMDSIKI